MLAFRELGSLLTYLTSLTWTAQAASLLHRDGPFLPYLQLWYYRLRQGSGVLLLRRLNARAEADLVRRLQGQPSQGLPAWQRWCCHIFGLSTVLTILSSAAVAAQPQVNIVHVHMWQGPP